MRCLVLSARHEPRLVNGPRIRIHPKYRDPTQFEAIVYNSAIGGKLSLRKHPKLGLREPNWQNRKTVEGLLNAIGYSEMPRVKAAGAYAAAAFPSANPVEDLATARNFYGHRNEDTANKLRNKLRRNYSIVTGRSDHPTDVLLSTVPFGVGTPLDIWATAVEKTAEEMVSR